MKKLLVSVLILSIALLLLAYLFLPATQQPQIAMRLQANQEALLRRLIQQSLQQKKETPEDGVTLHPGMFNGMVLSVKLKDTLHNSTLQLVALGTDSTVATWNGVVKGGGLPWQRWHSWQQAKGLKEKVRGFMMSLHRWEKQEQLYGLTIKREKVRDTTLIAVRFETGTYPSTQDIYTHVDLLKAYMVQQGAAASNHPMLYVRKRPDSYEVMVGLPTNRELAGKGLIELKRMVMGNILAAEVKGGDAAVQEGMRQLEDFVSDHDLISPAIPFISLVTDRSQQPDSSKWISKLYYPIF